jgi:hypothetical protein
LYGCGISSNFPAGMYDPLMNNTEVIFDDLIKKPRLQKLSSVPEQFYGMELSFYICHGSAKIKVQYIS